MSQTNKTTAIRVFFFVCVLAGWIAGLFSAMTVTSFGDTSGKQSTSNDPEKEASAEKWIPWDHTSDGLRNSMTVALQEAHAHNRFLGTGKTDCAAFEFPDLCFSEVGNIQDVKTDEKWELFDVSRVEGGLFGQKTFWGFSVKLRNLADGSSFYAGNGRDGGGAMLVRKNYEAMNPNQQQRSRCILKTAHYGSEYDHIPHSTPRPAPYGILFSVEPQLTWLECGFVFPSSYCWNPDGWNRFVDCQESNPKTWRLWVLQNASLEKTEELLDLAIKVRNKVEKELLNGKIVKRSITPPNAKYTEKIEVDSRGIVKTTGIASEFTGHSIVAAYVPSIDQNTKEITWTCKTRGEFKDLMPAECQNVCAPEKTTNKRIEASFDELKRACRFAGGMGWVNAPKWPDPACVEYITRGGGQIEIAKSECGRMKKAQFRIQQIPADDHCSVGFFCCDENQFFEKVPPEC